MTFFGAQILNGLALGSIYALLALGFTLVFGAANIINFTQGSLFMAGAFAAYVFASHGAPLWLAAVGAVVFTTLLGLAVDRLALRPIANGPLIAPLLSTIAVSVILDQGAQLLFGPQNQPFPNPFASVVVHLGGTFLSLTDGIVFVTALAAMGALWFWLSRTWMGRAVRATAQDAEAALQMGVSTVRVRAVTFALAGALGGLGGILVGLYFQNIFPTMGLNYGIKGFAAAILGGIASFPGAIVGGLLLGILESMASGYAGEGSRDLVAYSLLLAALIWRPQGLLGSRRLLGLGGVSGSSGGVPSTSPLASAGSTVLSAVRAWHPPRTVATALLAVLALLPLAVPNPYVLQIFTIALIFSLVSIGLTLVAGTAGQISLGYSAVVGIGAYVTALIAKSQGWPLEIVLPLAGLASAIGAVAISLPSIKLGGHVVALATLASGQIVYLIMTNWIAVTRGPLGIPAIPSPALGLGGAFPLESVRAKYWLALAVLTLGMWLAQRVLRSGIGRAWRAIREDKIAARAAGLSPFRYLAMVNGFAGFLTGMAGAMFAYYFAFVSPDSFDASSSILLLTMVVIGGLGNVWGATIGGSALAMLPELLRGFIDVRLLVYGAVLLVVFRFRPQGVAGSE